MKVANSVNEFLLMQSKDEFLIKNKIIAKELIVSHYADKLSEQDIDWFIENARFKNNALAHCEMGNIKSKLTESEFESFFEMFGISKALYSIYENQT